jgi:hypothetical protein
VVISKINLQIIVQFNGVRIIVGTVTAHADNPGVLKQCVRTLDAIALGDDECRNIVLQERGAELIQVAMKLYEDQVSSARSEEEADVAREVVDTCQSAILAIGGGGKKPIGSSAPVKKKAGEGGKKKAVETKEEEPEWKKTFEEYRSKLVGGAQFTLFPEKGKPTDYQFSVSEDLSKIVWKNRKFELVGELACSEIFTVTKEKWWKRTSLLGRNPKEDRCVSLITPGNPKLSLHLECLSADARDIWLKAFSSLLIYRQQSSKER